MRSLLVLVLMLAGCSRSEESASVPPQAVASAAYYERIGVGTVPDAICMTGEGKSERFGLAIRGAGAGNCTATGSVSRQAGGLALRIDGAPDCTLQATATGDGIDLAPPRGSECGFYCGAGATMTGGRFNIGAPGTRRAATDLVGKPLC